jgi:hypothetical protein
MGLTGRAVARGLVDRATEASDILAYQGITVPLARCSVCGRWARVLPLGVLPGKTYGVGAHEVATAAFFGGDRTLREAVDEIAGVAPKHSTLHGWLGGMGHWAQGRDDDKSWLPISVLRVETTRLLGAEPERAWAEPVEISPFRYKSERRREELLAAARFLRAAKAAWPDSSSPLTTWARIALTWGSGKRVVGWWARSRATRIQQQAPPPPGIGFQSDPGRTKQEAFPCPIPNRSPPSGSR